MKSAAPSLFVTENEPFEGLETSERQMLRRLLKGNFRLREAGWVIQRNVGHVTLPTGRVLHIRSPKATAATLLSWLCYDDPALRSLKLLGHSEQSASDGDLSVVVALLFTSSLRRALMRHGITRHYERTTHRVATLRGRILFPALARAGGDMSRVPCETFERETNTPLNALFAQALRRVSRDPVMRSAARDHLGALGTVFNGVIPKLSPRLAKGPALPRHLGAYNQAYRLALLLLNHAHLGDGDEQDGPPFLINIESLFERTVARAWLASEWSVRTQRKFRYERLSKDGCHLKWKAMSADVLCDDKRIISQLGGPLVIDAKFKRKVDSANLQQMVTYCHFSGARHAVLVLPEGAENVGAKYEMNGPSGTIMIATVGLPLDVGTVEDWKERGRELVRGSLAVVEPPKPGHRIRPVVSA